MRQDNIDQAMWMPRLIELGEQIDGIGATLRLLWILNLAAAVAGIIVHQYVAAVVAGISSIVSLLGTGISRGAKRTLESATSQCRNGVK